MCPKIRWEWWKFFRWGTKKGLTLWYVLKKWGRTKHGLLTRQRPCWATRALVRPAAGPKPFCSGGQVKSNSGYEYTMGQWAKVLCVPAVNRKAQHLTATPSFCCSAGAAATAASRFSERLAAEQLPADTVGLAFQAFLLSFQQQAAAPPLVHHLSLPSSGSWPPWLLLGRPTRICRLGKAGKAVTNEERCRFEKLYALGLLVGST